MDERAGLQRERTAGACLSRMTCPAHPDSLVLAGVQDTFVQHCEPVCEGVGDLAGNALIDWIGREMRENTEGGKRGE